MKHGLWQPCPTGCEECKAPEAYCSPNQAVRWAAHVHDCDHEAGFSVPPRGNLLWVGVDLDGTLAEPIWTPDNPTSGIGKPIQRNVAKLRELVDAGYKVIIHSSRPWTDYEAVEAWLDLHLIPYKGIQLGKPLFALYVDDRGRHSEEESWLP